MARTYSTASVVSADMPFAVRYSSREVRRKVPFIKNSKGIGFSYCRRVLTRVERAYRRRSGDLSAEKLARLILLYWYSQGWGQDFRVMKYQDGEW